MKKQLELQKKVEQEEAAREKSEQEAAAREKREQPAAKGSKTDPLVLERRRNIEHEVLLKQRIEQLASEVSYL